MPRQPYPLALSLAALAATWLGLAAATLGLKWGAAPAPGDAIPYAWLYVNVMFMLVWLALWPALALRATRRTPMPAPWEWAAILVAALPALALAAWLSEVTPAAATPMLALQSGASLLALAFIHRHRDFPRLTATLAILAAALTLAGPIAAFLGSQFFPLTSRAWFAACPLLAVGRAAGDAAARGPLAVTTGTMAALGLLLLLLPAAQEKAPDTAVPGA